MDKYNSIFNKYWSVSNFCKYLFSVAKMLLVSGRPTLQVREDYDSLQYAANTLILLDFQSYILNLLSLVFLYFVRQALVDLIFLKYLSRICLSLDLLKLKS
jgi:hypothetical protein